MGNIEDSEYANWSDESLIREIERLAKQLQVAKRDLGKLAGFITPNTLVWYEASPGKRFAAVVDEPPRELGSGQWCVRLRDLDEAYRKYNPNGHTTVAAAATWCLSPREGSADHPFPGLGTQIQTRDDRPGEVRIVSAPRPVDDDNRRQWRASIRAQLAQHKPSAAADFDALRFVECAACGQKPGSPTLCAGCLANRQTIDELHARHAELTLQISRELRTIAEQTDALKKTADQHRTTIAELTERDKEWRDQVSRQKKQLDDAEQQIEDNTCARHAGQAHGKEAEELRKGIENILATSDATIGAVDRRALQRLLDDVDARDSLAYLESKNAAHIRQVAEDSKKRDRELRKADAPDFKDAATLSLVELAHRLFRQIPNGLDWDGSHEWRIAMGVWQSRYHALLGAQPAPPKIKHRFALARSHAGLSIGQAARILGVDRRALETIEESPETDDAAFVRQMAEKYQVNIPWLVGETPLRDYAAMAGARGYEHVSDHDRDVIAEFAASLPRGAITKKAQELRDKIRGAKMPSPDEANAELKKLLGEDE